MNWKHITWSLCKRFQLLFYFFMSFFYRSSCFINFHVIFLVLSSMYGGHIEPIGPKLST